MCPLSSRQLSGLNYHNSSVKKGSSLTSFLKGKLSRRFNKFEGPLTVSGNTENWKLQLYEAGSSGFAKLEAPALMPELPASMLEAPTSMPEAPAS